MKQALSGIRVVDLTHYIAGPYCTKLLADYGAEVLKIEKPGQGEGGRGLPPFFADQPGVDRSGLFFFLNTSKQDLTLDLKTERGREIALKLIGQADISSGNRRNSTMIQTLPRMPRSMSITRMDSSPPRTRRLPRGWLPTSPRSTLSSFILCT